MVEQQQENEMDLASDYADDAVIACMEYTDPNDGSQEKEKTKAELKKECEDKLISYSIDFSKPNDKVVEDMQNYLSSSGGGTIYEDFFKKYISYSSPNQQQLIDVNTAINNLRQAKLLSIKNKLSTNAIASKSYYASNADNLSVMKICDYINENEVNQLNKVSTLNTLIIKSFNNIKECYDLDGFKTKFDKSDIMILVKDISTADAVNYNKQISFNLDNPANFDLIKNDFKAMYPYANIIDGKKFISIDFTFQALYDYVILQAKNVITNNMTNSFDNKQSTAFNKSVYIPGLIGVNNYHNVSKFTNQPGNLPDFVTKNKEVINRFLVNKDNNKQIIDDKGTTNIADDVIFKWTDATLVYIGDPKLQNNGVPGNYLFDQKQVEDFIKKYDNPAGEVMSVEEVTGDPIKYKIFVHSPTIYNSQIKGGFDSSTKKSFSVVDIFK